MSVRTVPAPRIGYIRVAPMGVSRSGAWRKLWQRMADDRDLIEVKLVVLAGVTLIAMAIEFYL